MAAIERFRDAQYGRQLFHFLALVLAELEEIRVIVGGRPFAVISRHVRDNDELLFRESAEIRVPDQVVSVLVISAIADVHSAFVKQRGVFEQLEIGRAHV